jgi:Tfp pilus assembly protein PilZ
MPSLPFMSMEAYIKKGGLINSGRKNVKYGQEILELLEAVWAPKQIAVMHCQGYQQGKTTAVWGN